jgi:hypothetical protein
MLKNEIIKKILKVDIEKKSTKNLKEKRKKKNRSNTGLFSLACLGILKFSYIFFKKGRTFRPPIIKKKKKPLATPHLLF